MAVRPGPAAGAHDATASPRTTRRAARQRRAQSSPPTLVARFLTYRVAVGAAFGDTLGGLLAAAALSDAITMASARRARRHHEVAAQNKSCAGSSGIRALLEASTETTLASVFFTLSAVAIASATAAW